MVLENDDKPDLQMTEVAITPLTVMGSRPAR